MSNRFITTGLRSKLLLACLVAATAPSLALAEADGPNYWAVTGVSPSSSLNLRLGPNTGFRAIANIPWNAVKLQNRGCIPNLNYGEWQALNAQEKDLLASISWCRVGYNNRQGWVAARFLRESNVH